MAADTAVSASPEETLESLLREAEALKQKLEEERQKLNDVSCKYYLIMYLTSDVFVYYHVFLELNFSLFNIKRLSNIEIAHSYLSYIYIEFIYIVQCHVLLRD